ncbi:hypothetical protein BDQ17DRAFT_1356596 [Cyathus striatus]|nr:hypothetical protein BDQ17DRAFT_1356596 [Cyathus striatus]
MSDSSSPFNFTAPMQAVSPPDSSHEEETTVVSPSDIIFCTTDSVLFYAHARTITKSCGRAFSSILDAPITSPKFHETIINVPDTSDVLNIILHCLYGTSCAQHSPSFDILETAIDRMPYYRIQPSKHIMPGTPLYAFILSHAPLYPLRLYALAAHHELDELAVHTSSHLLAVPLSTVQDDVALKMGAVYLNRLVHLHVSRIAHLKRILLSPPIPHPATKQCTFEDQKRLTRAWALVAAYLAWDARPDLSTYSMRSALNPLVENLSCELCNQSLKDRIKDVVVQWANVKRTI